MAKVERDIQHNLGLEGGKAKVKEITDMLMSKFGSFIKDIKWNDDKTAASVDGKGFSGNFSVTDTNCKILIELGLLMSPFKGKVETVIDDYVKDMNADTAKA